MLEGGASRGAHVICFSSSVGCFYCLLRRPIVLVVCLMRSVFWPLQGGPRLSSVPNFSCHLLCAYFLHHLLGSFILALLACPPPRFLCPCSSHQFLIFIAFFISSSSLLSPIRHRPLGRSHAVPVWLVRLVFLSLFHPLLRSVFY